MSDSRIEFLTSVRPITFPGEWYEANSEDHFWFEWRARIADALIARLGLPAGKPLSVLDIGCGTGITCRQLRRGRNWAFDGADLNVEAKRSLAEIAARLEELARRGSHFQAA